MKKCIAIILAAGQGKRMNCDTYKQYLLIQDKPVLYYSIRAFQESFVDEIILVVGEGEESYCQKEIVEKYAFSKVKKIIIGGKERYHSVYNGIKSIDYCDYLFIHDGARPFLTSEILERGLHSVEEFGACAAGMPAKDTVKITDAKGFVIETPNRDGVWIVQTPQVFSYDLIKEAYEMLFQKQSEWEQKGILITDDTMVAEMFTNYRIKLFPGSYENIKITTPEDLKVANIFLS